jgi:KDO2-lipid IV(A) lauroyltransferase
LDAIVFYLSVPFIYLLSLLPFPLLYLFSDFIHFILFTCIGYRKKVILQNLRNAFPEKSESEIQAICKEFSHYLCDLMVETFKILTISKKSIIKRCRFSPEGLAVLDHYAKAGKSTVMVMGHLGNWEWAGHPFSLLCRQQLVAIYHPLANTYFNRFIINMRSRFGTRMIPMKTAFKKMVSFKDELTTTVFLSDQTPMPENAYWTTFLNQETPVFKGTEVIARKLNQPVIYASIKKMKRGYYEMHVEELVNDPTATAEGEISEMHTRRLEKDILATPGQWLWSHKRWKHKKPVALAAR